MQDVLVNSPQSAGDAGTLLWHSDVEEHRASVALAQVQKELDDTRSQLKESNRQYAKLKRLTKEALQEFNRVKRDLSVERQRRIELEEKLKMTGNSLPTRPTRDGLSSLVTASAPCSPLGISNPSMGSIYTPPPTPPAAKLGQHLFSGNTENNDYELHFPLTSYSSDDIEVNRKNEVDRGEEISDEQYRTLPRLKQYGLSDKSPTLPTRDLQLSKTTIASPLSSAMSFDDIDNVSPILTFASEPVIPALLMPKKIKKSKKFGLSTMHHAISKIKDKMREGDIDSDDSIDYDKLMGGSLSHEQAGKSSRSDTEHPRVGSPLSLTADYDNMESTMQSNQPTKGIIGNKSHIFQAHTFKKVVKCGLCGDRIWGVNALEMMCRCCGFACHDKCALNVPSKCPGDIQSQSAQSTQKLTKKKNNIFGVDLTAHLIDECCSLPPIVEKCVTIVEAHGLDVEGIYRKSGPTVQIKSLVAEFERGIDPPLDNPDSYGNDISVITSILKQYLRELPNPLITFGVYPLVCEAMKRTHNTKAKALRQALSALPATHMTTLKFIFDHLLKVVEHSGENRMIPRNLGVVFGPTLMREPTIEGSYDLTCISVIEYMLEHHSKILGYSGKKECEISFPVRSQASAQNTVLPDSKPSTYVSATKSTSQTRLANTTTTSPAPSLDTGFSLNLNNFEEGFGTDLFNDFGN